MTTHTLDHPLDLQARASHRGTVQMASAWLLHLAALVAAVIFWRLTYTALHLEISGEHADFVRLIVGQEKMLLIGCHVIPYALVMTGCMIGGVRPATTRTQRVLIGVSLLSLACAATALGIG